jgi:hypothetical protein
MGGSCVPSTKCFQNAQLSGHCCGGEKGDQVVDSLNDAKKVLDKSKEIGFAGFKDADLSKMCDKAPMILNEVVGSVYENRCWHRKCI